MQAADKETLPAQLQWREPSSTKPSTESDIDPISTKSNSSTPDPNSPPTQSPVVPKTELPPPHQPIAAHKPIHTQTNPVPAVPTQTLTTATHTYIATETMFSQICQFSSNYDDLVKLYSFMKQLCIAFCDRSTMTDAEKITAFEDFLKVDSMAEAWFRNLAATDKALWAALEAAFKLRWLQTQAAQQTPKDVVHLLYEDVLTDTEVGALVPDANSHHVLGHIQWTRQVEPLFVLIGSDPTNSVIENVQQRLPEVLRAIIPTRFANYTELIAAIRQVNTKTIQRHRENMETARVARMMAGMHILAPQYNPPAPQAQAAPAQYY
jgi:hypothetical protein